jgi:hypothetical protein
MKIPSNRAVKMRPFYATQFVESGESLLRRRSIGRSWMLTHWPNGLHRTDSLARSIKWTPKSEAATRCRSPISRPGKSHSFGGRYLELVPLERIRHTDKCRLGSRLRRVAQTVASRSGEDAKGSRFVGLTLRWAGADQALKAS